MNDPDIIKRIKQIVLDHIDNEHFGVSELTSEIGLSNARLLKKVKDVSGKTISEIIKEIRLKEAYKLLRDTDLTASEVSYRVGFGSPSYFNKCFHEFFGNTPGNCDFVKEEEDNKIPLNNKTLLGIRNKYWFYIVPVLLLIIVVTFFTINRQIRKKSDTKISVAVLPFKNFSNNKENQYFADGVMDDILGHLSAMEGLRVISRTTMESYRDTKKTIPEIAKELKVSYIIESSIQKYRDTVRLTLQLIDAKKDIHVWSRSFKREFKNIFALESEISMQIAKKLNTTLSPSEIRQIRKKPTENLEAYEFYLKGRFYWIQKTKEDLEKSIFYYEKALELDSDYALAYSGLADTYLHMAGWGWYPRIKGLDKSKEYVQKALTIDNNIAEAYTTLGGLLAYREWKWSEAIEQLKYAISLKPSYAISHEYYSQILDVLGKDEEARKEIDIALGLDPYSISINQLSSIYYLRSEKYDLAMKKNKENQKVFKGHPLNSSLFTNFKLYVLQKEYDKAYDLLIKILESNESTKKHSATVKKMYKESGINGIYRWLILKDLKDPHNKYFLAESYTFLGDKEKALSLLEECCEERSIWAPYIKNNPFFNDLHSEPRFNAILKKMNMYDEE